MGESKRAQSLEGLDPHRAYFGKYARCGHGDGHEAVRAFPAKTIAPREMEGRPKS